MTTREPAAPRLSPADADALATMVGGACSGSLARVPLHPLDTLKARLQAAPAAAAAAEARARAPPSALAAAARELVRAEGARALYRGFGVAFVGGAPASCLYFGTYAAAKAALEGGGSGAGSGGGSGAGGARGAAAHLAAGMAAEAVSCVLWVPIDVVKERLQTQQAPLAPPALAAEGPARPYRGALDAFRTILAREGVRGLYRGYGATLASFGPFSGLYFALYEQLKAAAQARVNARASARAGAGAGAGVGGLSQQPLPPQLPFALQVATASAAGAAASFATSPLDLVKLRLQLQRGAKADAGAGATHYRGMAHGLASIVREEGWRALWRGAGARVAFHAPSTALAMVLFERCKSAAEAALLRGSAD
jgi:hypothetical protein